MIWQNENSEECWQWHIYSDETIKWFQILMTKQKLIKVTFKVEVSQKNIHRMHFMAVECGNMFLESAQVSLDMQCQMIWSGESSAAYLTLEWFHSRVFSLKQGINTVCFYFVVTEVSANNLLVFLSLEIWDFFSWMLDIC